MLWLVATQCTRRGAICRIRYGRGIPRPTTIANINTACERGGGAVVAISPKRATRFASRSCLDNRRNHLATLLPQVPT